jgi:hypothetical protein
MINPVDPVVMRSTGWTPELIGALVGGAVIMVTTLFGSITTLAVTIINARRARASSDLLMVETKKIEHNTNSTATAMAAREVALTAEIDRLKRELVAEVTAATAAAALAERGASDVRRAMETEGKAGR